MSKSTSSGLHKKHAGAGRLALQQCCDALLMCAVRIGMAGPISASSTYIALTISTIRFNDAQTHLYLLHCDKWEHIVITALANSCEDMPYMDISTLGDSTVLTRCLHLHMPQAW